MRRKALRTPELANTLESQEWLTERYQRYRRALGKEQGIVSLIQEDLTEEGFEVRDYTIRKWLKRFGLRKHGRPGIQYRQSQKRGKKIRTVYTQAKDSIFQPAPKPSQPIIREISTPSVNELMKKWDLELEHARYLQRLIVMEDAQITARRKNDHTVGEKSRREENSLFPQPLPALAKNLSDSGLVPEMPTPETTLITDDPTLSQERSKSLRVLEASIGIRFKRIQFLDRALTHRSFLNETKDQNIQPNEEIEFLGDAVLELIIRSYLVSVYSDWSEGDLTQFKIALVNNQVLAEIGEKLKLLSYLRCSKGELKELELAERRKRLSAATFEALVGAIYLDQGKEAAQQFIMQIMRPYLEKLSRASLGEIRDPKSLLQELTQAELNQAPGYSVLEERGPDHDKEFVVCATLKTQEQDLIIGFGKGLSKKEAELKAAKRALELELWRNWNEKEKKRKPPKGG